MARVPTYDNFQVTPNTLPQNQVAGFQMQNAPDIVGQQARQMGQALGNAGQQLGLIATKAQEQANRVRLDAAMNRVKEEALRLTYDQEAGYTNLRGINALERPDGKPLADEYAGNLNKYISQVSADLGNNVQRAAFSQATQGLMTNFRGQLLKHESDEFRTYAASVSEGVQATALREVALSWDNPEAIDKAVHRIRAHTYQQAQMMGKSAEWQEAQVRKMVSTAHTTALAAALENNHALYADSYLKKYAGQMEADDILRVRGLITKTIDLQVGDNVGAEVFATYAPEIAPNDFSRLTNIVMGIESGGRRYGADGNLLEGPQTRYGTAKGEMQVLDGTNKNPGFGVTPAQDDSPTERARVGRDYLAAMLKEYKGDVGKALAAYNWGPGNVDSAVKEHGGDWLTNAPKETRDYVARALNRFGTGAGAAPKPTLMEMLADLRAQPELANNPERLKHAEARVKADFKAMNDAIDQRQGEALDAAYQEVYANGGNFAALPPSVRMAIPGDKLNGVMTFAEKVTKGNIVTSPAVYQRLSDPATLMSLSEGQFFALRAELSESDWHMFAKQRASNMVSADTLNTGAINQVLKHRLNELGINPSPKDGSSDARRVGVIRSIIDKSILGQQHVLGNQMTDAQVEQHIDRLFMSSVELKGVFGGTERERLVTLQPSDVPDDARRAIRAAYAARGIADPNAHEVLRVYIAGQLANEAN